MFADLGSSKDPQVNTPAVGVIRETAMGISVHCWLQTSSSPPGGLTGKDLGTQVDSVVHGCTEHFSATSAPTFLVIFSGHDLAVCTVPRCR